jgi:hypothetical protein
MLALPDMVRMLTIDLRNAGWKDDVHMKPPWDYLRHNP